MATLIVRNFPEELYRKLKALAAENNRSVSEEVIAIVEEALERRALKEQRLEALKNISEMRKILQPSSGPSSLDDIREDRAR